MKHGQCLWCAICDIHVNNRGDRDFTIGRWREHKKNVGHKKALANNIATSYLKKREKASYILNEREKKHINFRKKSNTSPLTALFLKKRNNGGSGTKTTSAAGVANGTNVKTGLVTYLPPKQKVQVCKGIFVDYMNMSFQAKLSAYIQYAYIYDGYLYKVVCVGEFVTFFAKSCICDVYIVGI